MSALEIFESEARENYNKVVLHKKLCIPLTEKGSKPTNRPSDCDPTQDSPNLTQWRTRQEAERERIRKLNHTPQPPERPPKKMHLRPPSPPTLASPPSSVNSLSEEISEIISTGSVKDKINLFAPKPFVPPPPTSKSDWPPAPTFQPSVNKHISKFQSTSSFQTSAKPSSIKPFSVSASSLKPSAISANNLPAKSNGFPKKKPAVAPKPAFCRSASSELLQRAEPVLTTSSELLQRAEPVHTTSSELLQRAEPITTTSSELLQRAEPVLATSDLESPDLPPVPLQPTDFSAKTEDTVTTVTSELIVKHIVNDKSGDSSTATMNARGDAEHIAEYGYVVESRLELEEENHLSCGDPNLSADVAAHLQEAEELDRRVMPPSPLSREVEELQVRKRDLLERMDTKLSLLRSDKVEILSEVHENNKMGEKVESALTEAGASMSEVDKLRVHITEVERLTSLLAVLGSRLERTEKVLAKCSDDKQEFHLKKKSRLLSQLEEAQQLKEFRERRGEVVKKMIQDLLSADLVTYFSVFLAKKVSLITELKQLEERIQMGEDQITDLSGAKV